jgi:hypothetical protein
MPPNVSSNASFCSPSGNTAKADRRTAFVEAYETRTEPPDSTASVLASITLYLQLATFCPSVPFHGRASASYGTMKRFDGRAFNVGHGPEAKPLILSDDNIAVTLISFDEIRLQHPFSRHLPVWQHLPSGRVLKPHSAESITFHKLLNTVIPLG